MRRTLFTSILAAASLVITLPSLAHAAPPNSLFRQTFLANQQTLIGRQQTLINNQQMINQQLLANAQRGAFNRSVQLNRALPLAEINRSQAFMGISNAARLNQTAQSSFAFNTLGMPAASNVFGTFPSNTFFNPSAYAGMYGLSFNGTLGASALAGFPFGGSSQFSGFPGGGFVAPTSVTPVP